MYLLLFNRLSEKVTKCDPKEIQDYEFEGRDFANETYESAHFQIHSDMQAVYSVKIDEDRNVTLCMDDTVIALITGENAENWKNIAKCIFLDRYEAQIDDAKKENAYWNWASHQDTLGELSRHSY